MEAVATGLLKFLQKSPQFIIPIYQRTYSWGIKECQQLWSDIIRAGDDRISAHFVGSIVYIEKGLYHVSTLSPLLVIDGQQRLTTISLILEALSRIVGDTEIVSGLSSKKIHHYYLLNPIEEDEQKYKLLLTQTDNETLKKIVTQKLPGKRVSIRILENFQFFQEKIKNLTEQEIIGVWKGLQKLVIVDISLNRDHDNPQLIFESMNSTGKELSQADLIRNYILMGLEPNHQTELYNDHWRPMETDYGQEAYLKHFDLFIRHYLTLKTGEIPNKNLVYENFKIYSLSPDIAPLGVDKLVADIHKFSTYYCNMVLDQETDKTLSEAFKDLREFKVEVSYPLLLKLYDDYQNSVLTKDDFIKIVRLVESYVFRRTVCNIPTNSLNKTFANFHRGIKKEAYLESVKAQFLLLPSYRRFPDNEEFSRELKIRDLYNFPRRSYWLRRMENFCRKERVPVEEYTIEHILPQNEDLSPEWKASLGANWKKVQENWLHTIGNLTLTGYNSEYSDHPFEQKRDMEGGFRNSPLKLNEGLGEIAKWDEDAIVSRAIQLTKLAKDVWIYPNLDQEDIEKYKKEPSLSHSYTLADHKFLQIDQPMRKLFDDLRIRILSLDEVVTEEYLKLYVAYKAETNFVDVVPQSSKLRLSLNMGFHEINDPRGICVDVSNKGRWGNGDVEVSVSTTDELPYVMGLIRHSFERQMVNNSSE